jgi:mono/diheme cytochrome c family protein
MRHVLFILAPLALFARLGLADEAKPPAAPTQPTAEQVQFFETKVRPVLANNCYKCHGPDKQSNDLRLDSLAAMRKGGLSGPAVVPGKPEESLLIEAVNHDGLKMPPKTKLKPEEIAALTAWVKMGAPWPASDVVVAAGIDIEAARRTYWAFQPVADPPVPAVKNAAWPKNAVDYFILAKLEAKNLTPVEPADKRTLIRRATFDLTGLPPTPEEIDAFLADDSPDAFAKVVDRLLASPHYGERWGRHWLDLVRYADTAGDNSDYPVPQLYKYRNWVIRAFNEDKPYDVFLREQIAGDLMPSTSEEDRYAKIIATGYLANARRFGSYEDKRYQWYLTYEDTIDNLGRTVLGLTVACARCHDHKFDPITMEDYYALYGFFQSTRYPWPGIELDKVPRDLIPLAPPAKVAEVTKERQQKLAALDAEVKKLDGERNAAVKALKEAEASKGEDRDQRIADAKKQVDELTKKLQAVRSARDTLAKSPLPVEMAYAVTENRNEGRHKVGNACIQIKGDPEKLGREVPRRFLAVLGGQPLPSDEKGSGRLHLANWLTDPANPLTARVMVNRIWQYHFGRGIVPTASNFGKQGQPPTHPELLDYLTRRFIESGWSVKAMHRLIMLSQTYQLASRDHAGNLKTDPDNVYRWRFDRRRLDAESIRDAMLAVSGALDRTPGGPHPFPDQTTWNFTQHNPFKAVYETDRRSVYLMTQRIQRHPYLALFDGPDTNASTAQRNTSTTPLQALFLLNDPFVHEQARKFAARLLAERSDDGSRVERAYLLALGRPPTADERAASQDYLARARAKLQSAGTPADRLTPLAWESYVRALLMTNEFVYVN